MKHKLLLLALVIFSASGLARADDYPKINVNGYKKWEYRLADVNPKNNYFLGLTQLGGYSPTVTGGPWQERLQLSILGQLTEKLKVTYDIEQQPESPDKYDVKVNYDNKHELAFGDLTASFTQNEFASATKFLNGVMITSKDNGYSLLAVPSAKLKSQVQNLTSQKGTNTRGPYSLGHGTIVEGSERIELNGVLQQRNKDYVIDYFEGKITFNRILTDADSFAYSYEYTNIMDLFFPALSKKDFFGFEGKYTFDPTTWGRKTPAPAQVIETITETFPTAINAVPATKESSPASKIASGESLASPEVKAEINRLNSVPIEEIMADEAVGKYRLKNGQIMPFSEKISFRGVVLKKNEDYTIKYDEGKLALLLPVMPTAMEPIEVVYSYPKTSEELEIIPGSGSRGSYNLSSDKIIPLSERVFINDRLVVRDYDYTIDYDSGRLIFNYNVSNTSAIKVNYKHILMQLPPPPPPPKIPQELTVGMTYLRESAKKGTSTAQGDNVETRTYAQISSNNNTIYLSKFPVISTAEGGIITLKVGTRELVSGTDYAIPTTITDAGGNIKVIPDARLAYINDRSDRTDGYTTGTIKILTSLEAGSEVSIVYSYKKSVSGRFTGAGGAGRGPYYIKNYRNVVPGAERIDVWTTGSSLISTYVRNSSFEADGGATGYSISYDKDSPYIMFNNDLGPEKNFSIYFQYVAESSSTTGGDISQDVTGFNGAFKYGDLLQFDGAYARSSNDRAVNAVSTSESFTNFTVPTNKLPKLANTPLVENSESIFVNGNKRNRDTDYFIDYSGGQVNFYYITLTTQDVVSVDYQYQSSSGSAQQVATQVGGAYRYGVKSSLGNVVNLSYNRKQIDFDFSPLGGTAIGVGSDYKDFSVSVNPSFQDMSVSHAYRETINPISNSRTSFTRSYDRSYSMSVNPRQIVKVSLDIRNLENKGDPASAGGAVSADNTQNSYSLGLAPIGFSKGPLSFGHSYDGRRTLSDDNLAKSGSKSDYFHGNWSVGFTDRLKLNTDYQQSEPKSVIKGTQEVTVSSSWAKDYSYDLSLDLTFPRIQRWTAYAKLINHEARTTIPTPEVSSQTRNTTYHTEFSPFSMLSASGDYNRQETPSVTYLGKNPMTERTATSMKLTPLSFLSSSWSYTEDKTINESARESKGRSNTYAADWAMFSLDKAKLNSNYSYYLRSATSPSGTLDATNDQGSFTQNYSMSLTPTAFLTITPGFVQEEYMSRTSTTTQELRTQNQTLQIHVDFAPMEKLKMAGDYSNKITASISPDNMNRPKTNISIRTTLRVFDWGDLIHTLEQEDNKGEVQAGGTLPQIDYRRSSNTYNFSMNVPQDNPILSSIILTATLKYVRFENFIPGRGSDNLDAWLTSFDGTLNF